MTTESTRTIRRVVAALVTSVSMVATACGSGQDATPVERDTSTPIGSSRVIVDGAELTIDHLACALEPELSGGVTIIYRINALASDDEGTTYAILMVASESSGVEDQQLVVEHIESATAEGVNYGRRVVVPPDEPVVVREGDELHAVADLEPLPIGTDGPALAVSLVVDCSAAADA